MPVYGQTLSSANAGCAACGGGSPTRICPSGSTLNSRVSAVLKWSGATAERVDIFRNGKKLSNVANIGMYFDKDLKALAKTARYRLCEDTACSSEVKLEY